MTSLAPLVAEQVAQAFEDELRYDGLANSRTAAVQRLARFTWGDLLEGFAVRLLATGSSEQDMDTVSLSQILRDTVNGYPPERLLDAVAAFADVAECHPELAVVMGRAVFGAVPFWSGVVDRSPTPGRLTRDVYDKIFLARFSDRPTYLRGQVLTHPALTAAQRTLANALCDEWAGTYASMIETVLTIDQRPCAS